MPDGDIISIFQQLLQRADSVPQSAIGQRLGVASTAEAIRTLADSNLGVFKLLDDGQIEFSVTATVTQRAPGKRKSNSDSRTMTIRLEIEPGDTPDQARVKVHVSAMEAASERTVTSGLQKQAAIAINQRLMELGFKRLAVGDNAGSITPTVHKVTVDQSSIEAKHFKAAQARLEERPHQQRIGQQAVEEAQIEAVLAPRLKEELERLTAIDPAKDPQGFAVALHAMGLGDGQVDMLKLIGTPDQAEVEKLQGIHEELTGLVSHLERDPVGGYREVQRLAQESVMARVAEEVAQTGPGRRVLAAAVHALGTMGRKIPGPGLMIAGMGAAVTLADAGKALADNRITAEQFAAVIAAQGASEGCSAMATVPLVGTAASEACQEGVEAAATISDVPEELRPGTVRTSITAFSQAAAEYLNAHRTPGGVYHDPEIEAFTASEGGSLTASASPRAVDSASATPATAIR